MNYTPLKKYCYINKNDYNEEYDRRFQSISTMHFNFKVHGSEAFVVNTPEMTSMLIDIYKLNTEIVLLSDNLPPVAQNMYQMNCLIDEILLTNDIEGIYSTRREITTVLSMIDDDKKVRFKGLVLKYLMLLKRDSRLDMNTASDIRKIYDEIVIDEISDDLKPDGRIFRKDAADVVSPTQQVKHTGIISEERIIAEMDRALSILNDERYPLLIRAAVFHYLFGYIHPFYDGNGRTSRFISSSILSHELSPLVAYRLAYAIKNQKSSYYKAFDICNDKKNLGDITPFVLMFLDIILQGEKGLLERMSDGYSMLAHYTEAIAPFERNLNSVLSVLIQNMLFSNDPMSRADIAKATKLNYQTVTKILNSLIDKKAPIITTSEARTIMYKLQQDTLDEFLDEALR